MVAPPSIYSHTPEGPSDKPSAAQSKPETVGFVPRGQYQVTAQELFQGMKSGVPVVTDYTGIRQAGVAVGKVVSSVFAAQTGPTEGYAGLPSAYEIDMHLSQGNGVRTTNLHKLLAADKFVQFKLEQIDSRVALVNFSLLEAIKPNVRFDPKLVAQDIGERYSYMTHATLNEIRQRGDAIPKGKIIPGYTDKYGTGGSGRAHKFSEDDALFAKGGGVTPVAPFTFHRPAGGGHHDGLISAVEAGREFVTGEVNHHHGIPTTRIVSIYCPKIPWRADKFSRQNAMVILRGGSPPRPAHLRSSGLLMGLDSKARKLAFTNLLGTEDKDTQAFYLQYMMVGAAAKMRLSGIGHGQLSPDNMGYPTQLDFGTSYGAPSAGPHFSMDAGWIKEVSGNAKEHLFGRESRRILEEAKNLTPSVMGIKKSSGINVDQLWKREKTIETLKLCGIKPEIAVMMTDNPALKGDVYKLTKAIRQLGKPFHANVSTNTRAPVQDSRVFKVLDFLRDAMPMHFTEGMELRSPSFESLRSSKYFAPGARGKLTPNEDFRDKVTPMNKKYAVHKPQEAQQKVDVHLKVIADLYPQVMQQAMKIKKADGTPAYDSPVHFFRSVTNKAQFRCRPLTAMGTHEFDSKIMAMEADFAQTRHANVPAQRDRGALYESPEGQQFLQRYNHFLKGTVLDCVRNVEALMMDTNVYAPLESTSAREPSYILQPQTMNGMTFYLEADRAGKRQLQVEVPLSRFSEDMLSPANQANARIVVTRMGDGNPAAASSHQFGTSRFSDEPVLHLSFPAQECEYGELRGNVQVGDESLKFDYNSHRYIYATPDREELGEILAQRG